MTDRCYRAVLVDDSSDIRTLIRLRLEATGRFEVIGEGGDGLAAIELARAHQPDLLLLDVSMPRMDGLDALPQVRQVSPDTVVAMFTGFETPELADDARRLGAAALFHKGDAIRTIADKLLGLLGDRATHPDTTASAASEDEQAQLAEHLERFRELFDNAAIGMVTLTLNGRIARANEAARHLLANGSGDTVVGRPYTDFVNDEARATIATAIESVTSGAPLQQVEHLLTRSRRIALASVAAITDAHGKPLYLYLQVQDMTELRATERKLRATEDRLRLLIESVVDYAIFVLDPEGHISSWNAGAERIKGWREDEIVGKHFRIFYTPEAQAAKHPEHELEIAKREGRYEEVGWRVRKDGSRFWANVIITPLYDQGTLVGFGKVTRDITERIPPISLLDEATDDPTGLERAADS